MKIAARNYTAKRVSVVSQLPFDVVMTRFDSLIGHPDMHSFNESLQNSTSAEELTRLVQGSVSDAQLMEFARFNMGDVLKKMFDHHSGKSIRVVMGNPVIMSSMTIHVPDAGSYAPVTVLIDERTDGVHLTYDTMEYSLESYANEEALKIARDLDQKVLRVLEDAAGSPPQQDGQ